MGLIARNTTPPLSWYAATALVALLAGCENPPPPVVSNTRLYAIDQQGETKDCKVNDVPPQPGKQVADSISVGNDGGWCALTLSTTKGAPYGAGLLTQRPAHGKVYIHTVGDATRVDYTPERGYTGPDKFTIDLLPEQADVAVTVTVTGPK
jgi:hypothetical protein